MPARPLEPDALDYDSDAAWLCRPTKPALPPTPTLRVRVASGAPQQRSASGLAHAEEQPAADCFWVHPTLETGGATSNRLLSSEQKGRWTLGQAAAFSSCAAVWAPLYRQLVLGCDDMRAVYRDASALAYGDVRAAFVAFLRHSATCGTGDAGHAGNGRPLFLAGHSQGASHIVGLLREFCSGDDAQAAQLRRRLVGAYPVGVSIAPPPPLGGGGTAGGGGGAAPPSLLLPALGIEVCSAPGQPGVLATWQTVAEDAELKDSLTASSAAVRGIAEPLAVNPLNWSAEPGVECEAAHCGSLGRTPAGERVLYDGAFDRWLSVRNVRRSDVLSSHYGSKTPCLCMCVCIMPGRVDLRIVCMAQGSLVRKALI